MTRSLFAMILLVGCAGGQHTGGGGGGGDHGGGSGPVPAEVRKAIDNALGPNARVTSEKEDGKLIYEGATKTKLEVEVDEHGAVLQTEVAVPVSSLPEAVAKALAGKGKIDEAEVVLRGSGVAFEVEVGDTEYTVDATGAILSTEHEEGDEHDEHDDEDKD